MLDSCLIWYYKKYFWVKFVCLSINSGIGIGAILELSKGKLSNGGKYDSPLKS